MAELEIHHEGGEEGHDPLGKKVGVLAAVLAVLLAVVTIVSHRAHTDAVLLKSEANDKWSFYQSKRIKFHSLELGLDLLNALPGRSPDAEKTIARYAKEKSALHRRIRRSLRMKRRKRIRKRRRSKTKPCATTSAKVCSKSAWC